MYVCMSTVLYSTLFIAHNILNHLCTVVLIVGIDMEMYGFHKNSQSTLDECNALVSSVSQASLMSCSELSSHNSDVGLSKHSLTSIKLPLWVVPYHKPYWQFADSTQHENEQSVHHQCCSLYTAGKTLTSNNSVHFVAFCFSNTSTGLSAWVTIHVVATQWCV